MYTLTVSDVKPISITNYPSSSTAILNKQITYQIYAVGSSSLTYSLMTKPNGMVINSQTGFISYTQIGRASCRERV